MSHASEQLRRALDDYWAADNPREELIAYHEVLHLGGVDGYSEGWRPVVARWLRRLALKIER